MENNAIFSYENISKNLINVGDNILIKKEFIKEVKKHIDFDKLIQFMCLERVMSYQFEKEKDILEERIDKAKEIIKSKRSFETYQHLAKIYDDIEENELIWEDYEFDDLLEILGD